MTSALSMGLFDRQRVVLRRIPSNATKLLWLRLVDLDQGHTLRVKGDWLARTTGISLRQMWRSLNELEEMGVVETDRTKGRTEGIAVRIKQKRSTVRERQVA